MTAQQELGAGLPGKAEHADGWASRTGQWVKLPAASPFSFWASKVRVTDVLLIKRKLFRN